MSYQAKNNFSTGIVDTDSSHEYVQEGSLIKAENVDILSVGNNYNIQPSRGNSIVSGANTKASPQYLGSTKWNHKVYSFYRAYSDHSSVIVEYDSLSDTTTTILRTLEDVSFPEYDDVDFNRYVLSADVVAGVYLHWTFGVRQADGELLGVGEPKRIHIEDCKASPTTYSNFSNNYDKPPKLQVMGVVDTSITNNQLKFGSYIFHARYLTKYDEYTVISFPSNCINVSAGFGNNTLVNKISLSSFEVDDDIVSVQILVSKNSTATYEIIETIDTTTDKVLSPKSFIGGSFPVLSGGVSNIVNNNFPLTATEQEVAENALVFGDVSMSYEFVDENGTEIDRSVPFPYTATGLEYGTSTHFATSTSDASGNLAIVTTFTVGATYRFFINGWIESPVSSGLYERHIYDFEYTHDNDTTYFTDLVLLFLNQNDDFVLVDNSPPLHDFTVNNLRINPASSATLAIYETVADNARGLNTDFRYEAGVVYMDSKGRNVGVTNTTDIFYDGSEWTFNVKPILTNNITPPAWATQYMFVRTKIDTQLAYTMIGVAVTSTAKSGYDYYETKTPYYTDYIGAEKGKTLVVYSKSLNKDIEIEVLTVQDMSDEAATLKEGSTYIYIKNDIVVTDGSLILYKPTQPVESNTDVFFETSDVYNITNGVYEGDVQEKLNWYDTEVGFYDKTFATLGGDQDYVIMKTDTESLEDINHLGRGAYTVANPIDIEGNTTLVHSQKYNPETNYNGLGDFSYTYNNYKDLERKYGSIEKLFFDDTDLIVGQKRKWSKVLIEKNMLTTATGTGAVQSATSFFNQQVHYSGDYGITDKRSFDIFGNRKYFADQNNGIFGRLSVDGITPLNGRRENEIVGILTDHDVQDRIAGGYDVAKDEYVVALEGSGTILRFSELNKSSVGNYNLTTIPVAYLRLNTKLYSFDNSLDHEMWLEGSGDITYFYGTYEDTVVSFVVNQEPNIIKDFISTSINGTHPMDVLIETKDNETTLDYTEFLEREGVWYADYHKDESSTGGAVYGVGTLESKPDTTTLVLKSPPVNLIVGQDLYANNLGSSPFATVESYSGSTIILTSGTASTPDFIYTKRPTKVEGKSIKGNVAVVTLTGTTNQLFDMFSVTTNFNVSSNTQ